MTHAHEPSVRPVKYGVVPAGGLGTRFLPITRSVPKELLPILDTAVIELVVTELAASGITRVVLVVAPGKESVEGYFRPSPRIEERLHAENRIHELELLHRPDVPTGAVISTTGHNERKLGSVGKAIPGYEVAILDDDDEPVPAGELGEICCKGGGVMLGYWKAPEATAETLRNGWLHTGDIGRLDEDGYLWIVDRKKDLIIRGGFNVFPRDVEDALLEHPAVAMAGVVGRPDPKSGEEVVAFVSLHPGQEATPEELIAFAKERIGGYKYPREVHIGEVPLTPVGKVDRKSLRAQARGDA